MESLCCALETNLISYVNFGLPQWLSSKESSWNAEAAGGVGSISGLGRSPGGEHGNPVWYSCLENPHGQRRLAGYSTWGPEESDTTEQLSIAQLLI